MNMIIEVTIPKNSAQLPIDFMVWKSLNQSDQMIRGKPLNIRQKI